MFVRVQSALAKLLRLAEDVDCQPSMAPTSEKCSPVPVPKRARVMDAGKDRGGGPLDHDCASTLEVADSGESGVACDIDMATAKYGSPQVGGKGKRRRSSVGCVTPSRNKSNAAVAVGGDFGGGGEVFAVAGSLPDAVVSRDRVQVVLLEEELVALRALASRSKGLFEWVDGPLVTAMRKGELLLLDEISLAEDAVLERLNSVLEPGRSITLAEKGGERSSGGPGAAEIVVAAPGFRCVVGLEHLV